MHRDSPTLLPVSLFQKQNGKESYIVTVVHQGWAVNALLNFVCMLVVRVFSWSF